MTKLILITLMIPSMALASGKLSLEPSYDPSQDKSHLTFGLGVYESLGEDIAYNSWTGFGDSFDVDSSYHSWYSTKHQVDFTDKSGLVFSPGVRLSYLDHDYLEETPKEFVPEVYAKVSLELW